VGEDASERPRFALSRDAQAQEYLLMGLRLKEGVSLSRFSALRGRPLADHAIRNLTDLGMISQKEDIIIVSDQGFMILNAVISALLDG
ncbi:MAG: coproporphyrinogen III oxidase, partial [Roseobacter sp.]